MEPLPRQQYTKEFREQAVRVVREQELTIPECQRSSNNPQVWSEAIARGRFRPPLPPIVEGPAARRGHRCLALVANEMRAALRHPDDFLSRYGGEEFLAFPASTPVEAAYGLAERLRVLVEQLSVDIPSSTRWPASRSAPASRGSTRSRTGR